MPRWEPFGNPLPSWLGRLAVAKAHPGAGYGKTLLVDALHRIARVAELAGDIGLFVDAKDEAAADFYARFTLRADPVRPTDLIHADGHNPSVCGVIGGSRVKLKQNGSRRISLTPSFPAILKA